MERMKRCKHKHNQKNRLLRDCKPCHGLLLSRHLKLQRMAEASRADSKTIWKEWIKEWEERGGEGCRASRKITKDELSGRSEWMLIPHRLSGIERAAEWCTKRQRAQRGTRSKDPHVCYLHLRHRGFQSVQMRGTESATAGMSSTDVLTS